MEKYIVEKAVVYVPCLGSTHLRKTRKKKTGIMTIFEGIVLHIVLIPILQKLISQCWLAMKAYYV